MACDADRSLAVAGKAETPSFYTSTFNRVAGRETLLNKVGKHLSADIGCVGRCHEILPRSYTGERISGRMIVSGHR